VLKNVREKYVQYIQRMRNAYKILVGKPDGKRPLGRPKRRWENKIRMGIRDWMHVVRDRHQ
jgi:hypothetical protein